MVPTLPLKVKDTETPVLQRVLYGLCVDIAAARRDIDAAGGAGKKKKTRGRWHRADDEDGAVSGIAAAPTPPTAEYKVAPSPNGTFKSQYFDVESLKAILEPADADAGAQGVGGDVQGLSPPSRVASAGQRATVNGSCRSRCTGRRLH
jgi:hypothetical protein